MKPFTIENPIINSPFLIPTHYHTFDNDGFPIGIGDGRRPSSHRTASTAIAQPRKTQYEMPPDVLTAKFTPESRLTLSVADLPTKTTSEPNMAENVHKWRLLSRNGTLSK